MAYCLSSIIRNAVSKAATMVAVAQAMMVIAALMAVFLILDREMNRNDHSSLVLADRHVIAMLLDAPDQTSMQPSPGTQTHQRRSTCCYPRVC